MRSCFLPLSCCLLALTAHSGRGETWGTTNGDHADGHLAGIYGSVAVIARKTDSILISLQQIDDAGLGRIADYLAAGPRAAAPWAASDGKVARSLRGRLQVMQDGKLVKFDPGARPEPEIYLVYFGAHWCRPCRAFSPDLVATYKRLQELSPGHFELVFVSADRNASDQELYAREVGMPWPILKFSEVGSADAIERWAGPAIPDLIAINRSGDVIFNSFRGSEYLGPQSVLEQFEPLLAAMDERSPECRRARHRLSVLQYVLSARGKPANARPYLIAFDPASYQTLKTKSLNVLLEIDERGHVTDVKAEPELPSALDFQLTQDAGTWLFLPAVADGRARPSKAILPIKL
jgi:thiol-disulfide isomerase/thioredoxin